MDRVERILIFELNWMGDILFSLPFLRAIRKTFPKAYISCVVVPRYVALLTNNPWINDVHALSDSNNIATIAQKLAFVRMIRKEKYDMCFLLKPSSTKTVMAALAGIPERIGFAGKKAPLTKEVKLPSPELHRVDQILTLAGAVGVAEADGSYEYVVSHEAEGAANVLLHEVGGGLHRMVVVNTGGNWEAKKWPAKNFIELTKRMLMRFKDIEIMLSGSEKDIKLTNRIVSETGSDRCYSNAGKTGLSVLPVLFKKSALMISADSGPLHLASAVGTLTIGLFGPTSHKITGPRGVNRNIVIHKDSGCQIPCYVRNCDKEYECMKAITVDEVFHAAEKVLSGNV